MIDIHSHILPFLDDGADDWETALAMARIASEEGIHTMVATSHYIEGAVEPTKEEIQEKIAEFSNLLLQAGVELTVLPGHEIYLTPFVPQLLEKGRLFTLNDRYPYALIEFPMQEIPIYCESVIFELQCMGISPVLAHPERNRKIVENPNLLYPLLEKGLLTQMNSSSLTGKFGSAVQKTAQILLQCRMIHGMATDAHSDGGRAPRIQEASRIVREMVPEDYAQKILEEWPRRIIAGEPINPPLPQEYIPPRKKMSFLEKMKRQFTIHNS